LDSGERRTYRTLKIATPMTDGPRRLVVVCEDVTAQKAAADALREALRASEESNRLKSEFLANMSHETRTPLNGVLSVADLLGRTELDAGQQQMVDLIQRSGAALQRLLSNVRDLARLDAGQLELEEREFDIGVLVTALADEAARAAAEKGLNFRLDVQAPARMVRGDPARVRQILENPLDNAVKFTAAGTVGLRVAGTREGERASLRFEVHDTGPGFDETQKARIFGSFEQADGSLTRAHGGSGLGLPLASCLARLVGGAIGAASVAGNGAVFALELPLTASLASAGEDAGATRSPAGFESRPGTLRVLLAEDYPINRRVVEMMLAPAGVDLTCVENGAEAVEALERQSFGLVLMDMQMPVMDGLTATRLIRQREGRTGVRRTPIVSVTANVLADHVRANLAAGADLHLAKPLTVAALFEAMNAALSARGTEEDVGYPRPVTG